MFLLLVTISLPLMGQSRIGRVNLNSTEAEYREYFKKNILSLDPIEGIYQVESYDQEINMYRSFPLRKLDNSKVIIYKEDNGLFRISRTQTITRIGETEFYNFIADWKNVGGPIVSTRFSCNGLGMYFKITHEIPQKLLNKTLSKTYINAKTRVFIISNYIKEYPTQSMYEKAIQQSTHPKNQLEKWSGTGFALNMGYIVTNYHVIEGSNKIKVRGINGDFYQRYDASVVAVDKYNDLAILSISDKKFNGFGLIPYRIETDISDVGESIFVLGYPLTNTMGDEIKLTTGVISSRTGFRGNSSLYQISAPIQPGNSGGPLFDDKGNLIGIVSAKHKDTENVGYAIKTLFLKNLIESSISSSILPLNNQVKNVDLAGKVKKLKNYIFIIECSN